MKSNKTWKAITTLLVIAMLAGCQKGGSGESDKTSSEIPNSENSGSGTSSGGGDKLGLNPGQEIYDKTLVYDTSAEPYNVAIKINETKEVKEASSGRHKTESGEVANIDGVINFAGSFLSKLGNGEKKITITFSDNTTKAIDAFIATKIIRTAQDFQDINENLQGTYILGNDIDFAKFGNFEPLGYYLDETNPKNSYFHGILEGNGYSLKNMKVQYNSSLTNNEEAYSGFGMFEHESHVNGDNIGVFQIIGSSGVVRNVVFDGVRVRGRTIVGVIAGNVMGTVYNCIVTEKSSVEMSTHFYDNDCNSGLAFGIVAGSGVVENVITLSSSIKTPDIYMDFGDDYAGKIGNGWDHSNVPGNTDDWWQFANVNRDDELDSNGSKSNGLYSFAGKVWGTVRNSIGLSFDITPFNGEKRTINFAQTHLASIKPTSGPEDLGTLENCKVKTAEELKDPATFDASYGFDTTVFDFTADYLPGLIAPQLTYTIAE